MVAYNSVPSLSDPSGFKNYCYLSEIEEFPKITIKLKAFANLFSLILIPLLTTLDPTSSELYSNNIKVKVFDNAT